MTTRTITSQCKAKNRALCPYHGKGYDFKRLEKEALTAVTSGDFTAYTFVRNAMDEILRDGAYEDSTALNTPVSVSARYTPEERAARKQELKDRRNSYVTAVKDTDKEYVTKDKKAASKLKLKISAVGGINFKFYNPVSDVIRHPERFDLVDTQVSELKKDDLVGNYKVINVSRGVTTPTGKSDVLYSYPDGRVEQGTWWNSTKMVVYREKQLVEA